MEIQCPTCGETTKLSQEYQYHAGFSNRGVLYCDQTAAILKFSSYNKKYIAILGKHIHPWALSDEEKQRVEDALKPCPSGGRFRFGALPRCPKCQAELPDVLEDDIHFIEIGTVIDGDTEDVWLTDDDSS